MDVKKGTENYILKKLEDDEKEFEEEEVCIHVYINIYICIYVYMK
jgi:hypothetical protein